MKNTDNTLSSQGIESHLQNKEFSDKIIVYETLGSTNNAAKNLIKAKGESEGVALHGTVIIADSQSAGKGRLSRSFHSPPGHGIYMSIILRDKELGDIPISLITPLAAVVLCEAIESLTDKNPQIKWVNDILIGQKKICGILTEGVAENEQIKWVIIGIGINFTTAPTDFPEKLRDIAGSLFENEPPQTTRNRLIAEILNRLTEKGAMFEKHEVLMQYKKRLMILNRRITVSGHGNEAPYEGTAIDIDDSGHLIIKKDSGEISTLIAGDVSTGVLEN
ncbi:MAG: biotin--[acetyl-CoA-carboxylase] ligase [Oscillospiraceae bacterium]|nr:biotin--[acetyl-CoA-carboxylase] ligase [Oscillospiraceae bacterium]